MKKIAPWFLLDEESTYTSHTVDNIIASITNSAVIAKTQCHDRVNLADHVSLSLRRSNYDQQRVTVPKCTPKATAAVKRTTVLRALGSGSQAIPNKIHRQTRRIDFNRQDSLLSASRICCFPCKIRFVRPASGLMRFLFEGSTILLVHL